MFTCIEDLRLQAKRNIPKAIFDYVDGGSYSESTLYSNSAALAEINLRQRVMCDVANRSLTTTMLGQEFAMPLAIAPTGLTGLVWAGGEILAAKAAQEHNIPFCLSTMSICSIEQVANAVSKPFWFQLYMMRDKNFVSSLLARAKAVRCSALVLTLDLQIQGQRHRDIKNGLSVPPRLTVSNALNMLTKLPWLMRMAKAPSKTFGNLVGHLPAGDNLTTLSQWIAGQFDAGMTWQDVAWVREHWGGKLILKGILDETDAKEAQKIGADAIVVSNHGGRQLDGAPASINVLPDIVKAVGKQTEVWFDSGIRSGQDVLRALALGGKACMIGRSFLYGLGANGQAGVCCALDIIRNELDVSMALTGVKSIEKINEHVLYKNY